MSQCGNSRCWETTLPAFRPRPPCPCLPIRTRWTYPFCSNNRWSPPSYGTLVGSSATASSTYTVHQTRRSTRWLAASCHLPNWLLSCLPSVGISNQFHLSRTLTGPVGTRRCPAAECLVAYHSMNSDLRCNVLPIRSVPIARASGAKQLVRSVRARKYAVVLAQTTEMLCIE